MSSYEMHRALTGTTGRSHSDIDAELIQAEINGIIRETGTGNYEFVEEGE